MRRRIAIRLALRPPARKSLLNPKSAQIELGDTLYGDSLGKGRLEANALNHRIEVWVLNPL